MRFNLLSLGMLLTAGAMLQGCSTEEIEVPAQELYARDFIKTFGVIDPKQDWTAAQKSSVTVKTSTPTRVKVIAEFNGKQYLFADYSEVSGSQKLVFDLPKGVSDITVRANGRDVKTTIGATVDLASSGSRAFVENDIVEATPGEYMKFHPDVIKKYVSSTIDETSPNGYVGEVPEEVQNINNPALVENFWMVSQGPFVTYPIYWQSNLCHEVGVYYIPEGIGLDDGVHVPFHRNKFFNGGCDDLQVASRYIEGQEYYLTSGYIYFNADKEPLLNEDGSYQQNGSSINVNDYKVGDTYNDKIISKIEYGEIVDGNNDIWDNDTQTFNRYRQELKYYYKTEEDFGDWSNVNAQTSGMDGAYFRSQAYTIRVPEGYRFCFYIDVYEQNVVAEESQEENLQYLEGHRFLRRVYSSATMNEHVGRIPHVQTEDPDRLHSWAVHHVAEVNGQPYTYWSFEDWGGRDNDNKTVDPSQAIDLNDLVWVIASDYPPEKPYIPPTVEEKDPGASPEPFTWIVACEDLGGTYDYDFNDVVFGVQYIPGDANKRVYVTGLAAGGTLPVHLYYDGVELTGAGDLDQKVESEGAAGPFAEWHNWFGKASTQIVNVKGSFNVGATVSFVPNGEFTMSSDLDASNTVNNGRLHGFYVTVEKNGDKTTICRPTITGQPGDNTPQMFVTTYNFQWPTEMTPIYSTHRGQGADTGEKVVRFGATYNCNEHGFQHWVGNANAEFHTKGLSHGENTINHGWTGFLKIQPPTVSGK